MIAKAPEQVNFNNNVTWEGPPAVIDKLYVVNPDNPKECVEVVPAVTIEIVVFDPAYWFPEYKGHELN